MNTRFSFCLAVALVVALPAAAAGSKKPAPPPKCNSLKTQATCEARDDCRWVSASIDEKTKKQKKAANSRPP